MADYIVSAKKNASIHKVNSTEVYSRWILYRRFYKCYSCLKPKHLVWFIKTEDRSFPFAWVTTPLSISSQRINNQSIKQAHWRSQLLRDLFLELHAKLPISILLFVDYVR